jgi:membrane fusion protein (multidrug efflux system)
LTPDKVSRQLLDRAEAEARATAAKAQLELAEKQVQQAKGKLQEAQSAPKQVRVRENDLQSARSQKDQQSAALRQAELNLSYTKLYAPESGYITKKSVDPGNFVQPGQVLMGWFQTGFGLQLISRKRNWSTCVPGNRPRSRLTPTRNSSSVATSIAFRAVPARGLVC